MIQITPHTRIFVAIEPVDFRQGIDGLAQVCKAKLGADPFSGALFVFRSRSRVSRRLACATSLGL
jgi:transposase